MNYDIRKISDYFKEIHSRYYIDTNGCVYTSISENVNRILVKGKWINTNLFKKNNLSKLNYTNKLIINIPNTDGKYFLKNDGKILHRLSTRIKDDGSVDVCLIKINGRKQGDRYRLARLLAGCFLGNIENMEVHHKDGNRKNNNLDNLEILTFEEHRGKENHRNNHYK